VEEILSSINTVLGVMDLEPPEPEQRVAELIKSREAARKAMDWDRADRIRDELNEMGVELLDTRDGTLWRRA
jgi:cysteinyl-tRNA synthetase